MLIRFTKQSPERYTLHCIRRNKTATEAERETGSYLRHDFMHYILEQNAGVADAFFGPIAAGKPLTGASGRTSRVDASVEAYAAEVIVSALAEATRTHADPDTVVSGTVHYLHELNLPIPVYLTPNFVRESLSEFDSLYGRYKELSPGEEMEVPFAQEPYRYQELG